MTPAVSVKDALDKLELHTPDLIISETSFTTDLDGFELRRRVRGQPELGEIPFIFLTAETAIENKIRGLELGVDDYLTKPIYIKEIVTRINILLQKRQRTRFDERKDGTRFAGRVNDMPVVDVIQTIEISRKSGVINFTGERGRQAAIYFRDGRVIDAEAGTLQGEDAVYRLLTWSDGEFEVMFRTVRRREAITASSQGLLMEGMRRLDEWSRLLEQLPPLTHRFEVDADELSARLGEIPDENNRILRLIDGKRSLNEVIDASDFGDLECLQVVSRLYFEGLLIDLDPHERPRRDTGKPVPLVMVEEGPTSLEAVASGPILLGDLESRASVVPPRAEAPAPAPGAAAPTAEAPIVEEAQEPEEESPIPGPLMGGYRTSSLRLIDEAVAAAEAIEPSLFADDAPAPAEEPVAAVARLKLATRSTDPRVLAARNMIERSAFERGADDEALPPLNGAEAEASAPAGTTELEADEPPEPSELDDGSTASSESRRFAATIRREDSGLRMIGSHGRDRAEASGEVIPMRGSEAPSGEPQRELVTILPRRITREMPTVQVAESEAAKAVEAVEPVEPANLPPPPPRISVAGGVVRARGPSGLARLLLVAAACLMAATVYVKCRKQLAKAPSAGSGSEVVSTPPPIPSHEEAPPIDAAIAAIATPIDAGRAPRVVDAHLAAITPALDARVEAPRIDAGVAMRPPIDATLAAHPVVDAEHPDTGTATETNDHTKEARDLMEKAHDAVEEGDYQKAIDYADQSLKLRKTARTYLVRAQALQRLDRVDDALKSIDSAMAIVSDYPPAWELRGMILWSARRYEEARTAMNRYLELDPNGKSAPAIRRLLQEPR